jgi:hypothetical protein
MSRKIKTVTGKDGREIEVVTRRVRKREIRPMFGGPESVMGEGIQKDMDATVLEDLFALRDLGPQTPAISLDDLKKRRFASLEHLPKKA